MSGLDALFGLGDRVQLVWKKGWPVEGRDPDLWRADDYGTLMYRWDFGNRSSPHGWEIDHMHPVSLGGSDDLSNLRPLHCLATAAKGARISGALEKH